MNAWVVIHRCFTDLLTDFVIFYFKVADGFSLMDSDYIQKSLGVLLKNPDLPSNRKIYWIPALAFENFIGKIKIDVLYYYYNSDKLRMSSYETEYIVKIINESTFTVKEIPCPSNSGPLSYKIKLEKIIEKWLCAINPMNIQGVRTQTFKEELTLRQTALTFAQQLETPAHYKLA